MENVKVCYDGTVRDANDDIIQFQYGDDGFDATYLTRQKVPKNVGTIYVFKYGYEAEQGIKRHEDRVQKCFDYFNDFTTKYDTQLVSSPVDLESLLERAIILSKKLKLDRRSFENDLIHFYRNLQMTMKNIDNKLFKYLLITYSQLPIIMSLEKQWVSWFYEQVQHNYKKNHVEPGEMVGVLAGQSKFLFVLLMGFSLC